MFLKTVKKDEIITDEKELAITSKHALLKFWNILMKFIHPHSIFVMYFSWVLIEFNNL